MNRTVCFLILAIVALLLPAAAVAGPTGAPLVSYPVEPCRIFDTRVSGFPLRANYAMDAFVRGNGLSASDGAAQADCGVPASAEAVVVNIMILNATTDGYVKVNGTGGVAGPMGPYARILYNSGQFSENEIQVSLCNVYLHPAPHVPCPFFGATPTKYLDFQLLNIGVSASFVDAVGDVVGYLARE